MSDTIPVLSLLQPWASLVAIGAKRIETRSWSTDYRGPLAIHASKKPRGERRVACEEAMEEADDYLDDAGYYEIEDLPFGAIIAICRLVDCRFTGAREHPLTIDTDRFFGCLRGDALWVQRVYEADSPEFLLGDYRPNRYGWFLEDVRRLPEPISAKGALGLWQFPIDRLGEEVCRGQLG